MNPPNTNALERAILNAIEHETKVIVDDEAKKAAANVEARVKNLAASIATKVASTVDFETANDCTRITLRFHPRDCFPRS
jgi:hypothetical protein